MKVNKLIKINVLPLAALLRRTLNSLCKVIIILIHNIFNRDGINQNLTGIRNKPIKDLNQFKAKILVEGSKEENKFAIIFSYI